MAEETFVGEADGGGAGRLWFVDQGGVRREVPHVVRESPVGLSWGYVGKGPGDAALSILAAEIGDVAKAERYHRDFAREVIAKLPLNERFALPRADVRSWLTNHGHDLAAGRQRAVASPADDGQDHVEDLGARSAELAARSRALDERERQLVVREARADALAVVVGLDPEVSQAAWLPAEPVRRELEAMVVDTGDDIEKVARASRLDPTWAAAVVGGTISRVDLPNVRKVCDGLGCTPYDLWGTAGARSIAFAYGPDEWPVHAGAAIALDGVDLAPPTGLAQYPEPALSAAPSERAGPELDHDLGPDVIA